MDSFSQRFRQAFERSGMSVADLARRSGVNYHTIDKLKKGVTQQPAADTARALSQALGMDASTDDSLNRLIAIYNRMCPDAQQRLLAVAEALSQKI